MNATLESPRDAATAGTRRARPSLAFVILFAPAAGAICGAAAETGAGAGAAMPAGAATAAQSESEAPALVDLMRRLAAYRHRRASFVEQQFIALLDRPLESSGELLYDAPDHLEKRTLAPQPETLILDHGQIEVRRAHRRYELALRDVPQLAPFVDSIRATLAGDLDGLERSYALAFARHGAAWTLELVPRDQKLAAIVAVIRVTGTEDRIGSVEVRRADGDHSLMIVRDLPAR